MITAKHSRVAVASCSSSHRSIVLVLLMLIVVVSAGCAPRVYPEARWTAPHFNPGQYSRLAIVVEDNTSARSRNTALVRQIEDEFNQVMLEKGYRLAARSDIQQVMNELRFQHSGWTASDAARLGKILNVPAVVIVSIVDYSIRRDKQNYLRVNEDFAYGLDAYIKMSGRVISVQEAELLGQSNHMQRVVIASQNDLPGAIAIATRGLARGFPSRYVAERESSEQ